MPSQALVVDSGTFEVHRTARRTVVRLTPDRLGNPWHSPMPTDERSTHADERARELQRLLHNGEAKNQAELARRFGISRARISQILKRLHRPQVEREARK